MRAEDSRSIRIYRKSAALPTLLKYAFICRVWYKELHA